VTIPDGLRYAVGAGWSGHGTSGDTSDGATSTVSVTLMARHPSGFCDDFVLPLVFLTLNRCLPNRDVCLMTAHCRFHSARCRPTHENHGGPRRPGSITGGWAFREHATRLCTNHSAFIPPLVLRPLAYPRGYEFWSMQRCSPVRRSTTVWSLVSFL
jgi:hypothetical protein